MTTSTDSKVSAGGNTDVDAGRDIGCRLGPEDASRAHELRVGPELLCLILVNVIAGVEGLSRELELQSSASCDGGRVDAAVDAGRVDQGAMQAQGRGELAHDGVGHLSHWNSAASEERNNINLTR